MLTAARANAAPRADGRLDEPAWSLATPLECAAVEHIHPSYREAWSGPDEL